MAHKNDLEKLKATLEQKLDAQDIAQKHELEKLKAALKLDLMELQAALEQKLKAQEVTIKEMEQKLTIKLGVIVSVGVTALAALFALLTAFAA